MDAPKRIFNVFSAWCVASVALLLLPLFATYAATPKEQMQEAYNLLQSGKYEDAVAVYGQLESEGYESPALYYNMGNACYQTKETARAILNYERALRLSPNSGDILNNLKLANKRIANKPDTLPVLFYKRWWRAAVKRLPFWLWALLALGAVWSALWFATQYVKSGEVKLQKRNFSLSAALVAAAILFSVFACQKYVFEGGGTHAIVMHSGAMLKSGPSDAGKDLDELGGGIKVKIVTQVDDWVKVRLTDEREGWLKGGDIEVI